MSRDRAFPAPRLFIAPIIALSVALCAGFLTACSPRNPAPKQPDNAPAPQAESSVVLNSPLGSLVKDRDRAKAVQQTIDAQAAAQRKAIDDASH